MKAKKRSLATCKYCGKVFVIKPCTKGIFCSTICSNLQRKKEGCLNGTCLNCGKTFVYYKSCGAGKYCSNKCRVEHKKKFIEKTCLSCGKLFTVQNYERNRAYCSHPCFMTKLQIIKDNSYYKTDKFRAARSVSQKNVWKKIKEGILPPYDFSYKDTGEWKEKHKAAIRKAFEEHRHPMGEKITTKEQDEYIIFLYKTCLMNTRQIKENTGFSTSLILSRLREYGVERRKNVGTNNHFWKHGNSQKDYGKNWNLKRKEVLARDNYTCKSCFSNNQLHVHHIKEIGYFKTEKDKCDKGNNLSNLVTLCKKCHSRIHNRNIF